ncbi:M55 family metallopeptidase [Spirochaetota bacterium]
MKIFISTDMEGVGGLPSWSDMEGPSRAANYALAHRELSWMVNAMLSSEKGSQIEEICICDSHSRGEGIPYGLFGDSRVNHIRGFPRTYYMMQGLDESYDLAFLYGYHAKIGSERGGMDHSYSASAIYRVMINGKEVGEVEINSLLAGFYGVPVGLISGDDVLETELEGFFNSKPVFIRTKEGIGRFSAKMYPPERLEPLFRKGAVAAINSVNSFKAVQAPKSTKLKIELVSTVIADAVSVIPGLHRTGGRSVEYKSSDFRDIYRMINSIAMLGGKFAAWT